MESKNKKYNKINIIFFSIFAIISFIMIFFHEAWRDEAQQWLIARDLNVKELVNHLKYEGHFILWYLILMPFAKLGFPYITQNIISWLFVVVAMGIFMIKAPLKNHIKILTLFLYGNLYLFPIISRCYCLIPLAIVLLAIFYKDRKERPIRYMLSLVLLANTHVIMLGMVRIFIIRIYL